MIVWHRRFVPRVLRPGSGINGPWDMTALDMGTAVTQGSVLRMVFVSNVLNGTVAAEWGCGHEFRYLDVLIDLAD